MKRKKIEREITIYEDLAELSEQDQELLELASKARKDAYAPYSMFRVGAAVLLENKEVVVGNNQENASFPAGLCAERVAVFQAGAVFPGVPITTIAIVAAPHGSKTAKPAAPCGSCRQAIYEYERKQEKPIRILMMGSDGRILQCNAIADLLPLAFGNDFLG